MRDNYTGAKVPRTLLINGRTRISHAPRGDRWLAVRAGLAALPQGVTWGLLLGGGLLAGIGFTMALFISGLALDPDTLDAAKVGVLAASAVAAGLGMLVMTQQLRKRGGAEG